MTHQTPGPTERTATTDPKVLTSYAIEEHFKDDEKNSHNVFLEIVEDMTKIYKMWRSSLKANLTGILCFSFHNIFFLDIHRVGPSRSEQEDLERNQVQ